MPDRITITPASGMQTIDAGYALVHADTIIAATNDVLQCRPENTSFSLAVGDRSTSGPIADLGISAGMHSARLKTAQGKKEVRLVLVEPECVCRRFGARETSLAYDLPVIIGPGLGDEAERKVAWDDLWQSGPHTDVVVDFDADYKLIFWRGAGYVPAWAVDNILTTNFFAETVEPGVYRDCCEPMSDRECRYSQVRILHSSEARCIVHWRYALCDADYRICRDYWVDEYIHVYPDGVAMRNCTLALDPEDPDVWQPCPRTGENVPIAMMAGVPGKRSFSNTEFITVNPPGLRSEDVTPPEALTMLDLEQFSESYVWPEPPDFGSEPLPGLDQTIFRMNYRNRQALFLTTGSEALDVRLQANVGMRYMASADVSEDWWDRSCEVPGRFADFIHWPVTRGHWTRSITDPAMIADRPTHTFLGYAINRAVKVTENGAATWAWFCGMAPDSDAQLRSIARSWHQPGAVAGARYDRLEAAYHVESSTPLKVSSNDVHRATFVLPGVAREKVAMRVNSKEIACAVGVEETGEAVRTVITAKETLPAGSEIEFMT
jgi:hypothetical protein